MVVTQMKTLSQESVEEIRVHFEFFDENNNGYLDVKEFIKLLKTITPAITTEQGVNGFEYVDTNKDGLIEFDEFITWWRTNWTEF